MEISKDDLTKLLRECLSADAADENFFAGCPCNEICPSVLGKAYIKINGETCVVLFNYNIYHDETLETVKCPICGLTNGHSGHFSTFSGSIGVHKQLSEWKDKYRDDEDHEWYDYRYYMFEKAIEHFEKTYTDEMIKLHVANKDDLSRHNCKELKYIAIIYDEKFNDPGHC